MQNYKLEVDEEKFYKPRFFTFPDYSSSTAIFDMDDLTDDIMVVVCVRATPSSPTESIYVWQGYEFEEQNSDNTPEIEHFIEKVREAYWGSDKNGQKVDVKGLKIQRFNEEPGEESEEFNNLFD